MDITLTANVSTIPTYSRYEAVALVNDAMHGNPFVDGRLSATVTTPSGERWDIDGFCDSPDGSEYRVRVMPTDPGEYRVAVRFESTAGGESGSAPAGTRGRMYSPGPATVVHQEELRFTATGRDHPGIVQVDPEYPDHFRYSQSGDHYFWNGTTAYYLMGWKDDRIIEQSLSRLASKNVNRVRVLLYGRQYDHPWGQPIVQTDGFTMCLNPWPARYPDDPTLPEFDLSRFNIHYWRNYERMLEAAERHGIQVSVCFFIGGQQLAVPFAMWSEDEYRYYRYALARLAAYPNVTWDLGNEHDFHRDNRFWVHAIGGEIRRHDPYGHICGVHNKPYYDRAGGALTVQLHQKWDAGLAPELAEARERQREAGRAIPQVIEEYGYEDLWEQFPGQRSADTRRRVCWEVAMAGCYQTNGESARSGVGVGPDTGGGWISGRGDADMTMFDAVAHLVDFFTGFAWWRTRPDSDAILSYEPGRSDAGEYWYRDGRPATDLPAQALTGPDACVVYLPYGGRARVRLPSHDQLHPAAGSGVSGDWTALACDPRTGTRTHLGQIDTASWVTPWTDGPDDVAYLLRRSNEDVR